VVETFNFEGDDFYRFLHTEENKQQYGILVFYPFLDAIMNEDEDRAEKILNENSNDFAIKKILEFIFLKKTPKVNTINMNKIS